MTNGDRGRVKSERYREEVQRDHDGEPLPRSGPDRVGPLQPPLRPGGGDGGLGDAAVQPEAPAGRQVPEVREAPEWRRRALLE